MWFPDEEAMCTSHHHQSIILSKSNVTKHIGRTRKYKNIDTS